MTHPHLIRLLIAVAGIGVATNARAQTPTGSTPQSSPVTENVSVGATIAAGTRGLMQTVRLSAAVTPKSALDFDLGRISGNGATYGAQFRLLFRDRSASGGSAFFLLGVAHIKLESRTEVRFPNGTVTSLPHLGPPATPYVGIGGDVLTRKGVRVGAELTSGGGEWFVVYAKMFVAWGPPRR